MIAAATLATPRVDWYSIAPMVMPVAAGILIIVLRAVVRDRARTYEPSLVIGVLGLAATAFFLMKQWSIVSDSGPADAVARMTAVDGFSVFVGTVVIISGFLMLLLSSEYLVRKRIESRPEYVALVLFSVAGMLVMAAANDLIVVFVALEILSIPLYVLAAYDRRRARSLEAGIKYFVLGAFSSAIFLYGVALTYGATGSTNLEDIQKFLGNNVLLEEGTLLAGLALLLVGLAFKVAAVPFHMWTPDVYEGSPSPVTAFMASATKAAGFAALLRILYTGLAAYQTDWRQLLFVLAVLTLLGGSIAALRQTDLKRLLAYSSIAHAGYILIGVQAGTAKGLQSALVYLLVYAFMTIGAFAIVVALDARDDTHAIDDLRSLGRRRPLVAGLLAFFLLAQAGIPPTSGFIAKLGVFAAAAAAHSYALLIVGVVTSVITAYFYLRVILTMYAAEDEQVAPDGVEPEAVRTPVGVGVATVLAVCVAATIWIGILPTVVIDFAHRATLII
ncbi:MAG: NADH-quinone oxidoreductase subunit N [Acidimicrobiia bacterium]